MNTPVTSITPIEVPVITTGGTGSITVTWTNPLLTDFYICYVESGTPLRVFVSGEQGTTSPQIVPGFTVGKQVVVQMFDGTTAGGESTPFTVV